ncbi:hypothetical protein KCU57_15285 [Xanthomonas translucens]|uniref:hypothetical protein n=1 Tax=Xanthomonas campestris pv. translucens TaxID=343 RepID=UPI001F372A45|nr:hypothetical protein [Xanthomonas translucens]UKE50060.1 hypothetical protein KCU57_15285 [Xanthomonas translucens]
MDQERLDLEAEASRSIRQQDAEVKALLATLSNMDAIRWKEENRRVIQARTWLDAQQNEEQHRFAVREKQRQKIDLQWAHLQQWKIKNPEPWKIFPAHKRWLDELEKQERLVRTVHNQYKLAEQAADVPALEKLQKERTDMQRQLERALYNRQTIALLPKEAEQRKQQIVLPLAPPPPVPQPEDNVPKRARNRWARFPVLKPPGQGN